MTLDARLDRGFLTFATVTCVLIVGVLAYVALFNPLGLDQGMLAVAAQQLLRGHALYRDVWFQRGPIAAFDAAAGLFLFGPTDLALRFADGAALIIAAMVTYLTARRILGRFGGLLAALWLTGEYYRLGHWHTAQGETLVLPFWALTVYLIVRAEPSRTGVRWGALGLLSALMMWHKLSLVLLGPVLVGLDVVWRVRAGELGRRGFACAAGCYAAGLAVGIVPVVVWMILTGAWGGFVEIASWLAELHPHTSSLGIGMHLAWLGIYNLWQLLLPWMGVVLLLANRQTRRRGYLIVAALVAVWATVIPQSKYHEYHVAPAMIPGSIGAAALACWFFQTVDPVLRHAASRRIVALAILLIWPIAGTRGMVLSKLSRMRWQVAFGRMPKEELRKQVSSGSCVNWVEYEAARDIARITRPEDHIEVWGYQSLIYFYANRQPATRFIHRYPLTPLRQGGQPSLPRLTPRFRRQYLEQLARSRPEVFVVFSHDITRNVNIVFAVFQAIHSDKELAEWPELADYLKTNYEPYETVGNMTVYRRRSGT